jgi:hypothetical protein
LDVVRIICLLICWRNVLGFTEIELEKSLSALFR